MANGRNKVKGSGSGRDSGGFVALPWAVLDSPAYARLSMHARGLLLEVSRQFVRDNNGRLLLSRAYMATRGWKSADMLDKAKRELLEGGFIFQTVQGHRPNKASWYALTWQTLDRLPGFDPGSVETFERSAYRKGTPIKNTTLSPRHGTEGHTTGPHHGTRTVRHGPPHGSITAPVQRAPVPQCGHHLDKPSTTANQTKEQRHGG